MAFSVEEEVIYLLTRLEASWPHNAPLSMDDLEAMHHALHQRGQTWAVLPKMDRPTLEALVALPSQRSLQDVWERLHMGPALGDLRLLLLAHRVGTLTFEDSVYPPRLRRFLGHQAPPLLLGIGQMRPFIGQTPLMGYTVDMQKRRALSTQEIDEITAIAAHTSYPLLVSLDDLPSEQFLSAAIDQNIAIIGWTDLGLDMIVRHQGYMKLIHQGLMGATSPFWSRELDAHRDASQQSNRAIHALTEVQCRLTDDGLIVTHPAFLTLKPTPVEVVEKTVEVLRYVWPDGQIRSEAPPIQDVAHLARTPTTPASQVDAQSAPLTPTVAEPEATVATPATVEVAPASRAQAASLYHAFIETLLARFGSERFTFTKIARPFNLTRAQFDAWTTLGCSDGFLEVLPRRNFRLTPLAQQSYPQPDAKAFVTRVAQKMLPLVRTQVDIEAVDTLEGEPIDAMQLQTWYARHKSVTPAPVAPKRVAVDAAPTLFDEAAAA